LDLEVNEVLSVTFYDLVICLRTLYVIISRKKIQKSRNLTLKNKILCILAAILDFWPPYWI